MCLFIVGHSKNIDFNVNVESQHLILPKNECVIEAICNPKVPNEKGVVYHYQWYPEGWDKNAYNPFEVDHDGNKLILKNIQEGVHKFKVKVTYKKNDSDYRNEIEKTESAAVKSESGNLVSYSLILFFQLFNFPIYIPVS